MKRKITGWLAGSLIALGLVTTPAPAAEPRAALLERFAAIQEETEALRGLTSSRPLIPEVLDEATLRTVIEQAIAEELERPRTRYSFEFYRLMGLLPDGTNLAVMYQRLLEGQVGGLFDPKSDRLFVVEAFDPESFLGGVIISHEMTHALQHQMLDLQQFVQEEPLLDRQMARMAVIEGDATLLMVEWGAERFTPAVLLEMTRLFQAQQGQLNETPPAVVQSLVFPYINGIEFFSALRLRGIEGWRDLPFTEPPQSTSQILHPELFLTERHLEPILPELAAPAADSGWRVAHQNNAGEFVLRLFLTPERAFPRITSIRSNIVANHPPAILGAKGWRGDHWMLIKDDSTGEAAAAWRILFREESDPGELTAAWMGRVAGLRGSQFRDVGEGVRRFDLPSLGRVIELHERDREVVLLFADSDRGLAAARDLIPR